MFWFDHKDMESNDCGMQDDWSTEDVFWSCSSLICFLAGQVTQSSSKWLIYQLCEVGAQGPSTAW